MLKIILFIVLLTISVYGKKWDIKSIPSVGSLVVELLRLTPKQRSVMEHSYIDGLDYNLSLTLMAIAWQESDFGKWRIDLRSKTTLYNSYGVYHILLKTAMERYVMPDDRWEVSRLAETLILDDEINAKNAIAELTFWKKYWTINKADNVWRHMVASYFNGKASLDTDAGKYYQVCISKKVRALEIYMRGHKININK